MTPGEFHAGSLAEPGSYDSMLLAHVLEHLTEEDGVTLLKEYLPYVRPGGKVFLVCPQERGYASDPTHVRFVDGEGLAGLCEAVDLDPGVPFSFPFPRSLGKIFIYNEFCLLARVKDRAQAPDAGA
jgi:hypothetical protein